VSSYPGDTPVPWFRSKMKCAKCGARIHRIDVRPNWAEAEPVQDWRGRPAMPGGGDEELSPDYWRKRAEEARTISEMMQDKFTRETMEDIARQYDELAERAERRQRRAG
jgi:hypothetical protein